MGVNALMAFLGGLLSFLSPCVLPMAPGYLAIITGSSFTDLRSGIASKQRTLRCTIAFVIGLTVVFVTLGMASSALGGLLRANRNWLSRLAGVVVILLGLHQGGWLRLPWLYREHRVQTQGSVGVTGAFFTGAAFALGWTPCVGPILGALLALAGSGGDPVKGALLLSIYSLGLAIPFILLALGFERFSSGLARIKPYFKYLEWFSGALLVFMGILLATGGLSVISIWFIRITGGWNLENLLFKR